MGIPIADHVAAAMEKNENRERTLSVLRPIESGWQLGIRAGYRAFLGQHSGRWLSRGRSDHFGILQSCRWRIEALEQRACASPREIEYEPSLRV